MHQGITVKSRQPPLLAPRLLVHLALLVVPVLLQPLLFHRTAWKEEEGAGGLHRRPLNLSGNSLESCSRKGYKLNLDVEENILHAIVRDVREAHPQEDTICTRERERESFIRNNP